MDNKRLTDFDKEVLLTCIEITENKLMKSEKKDFESIKVASTLETLGKLKDKLNIKSFN